jgi:endonuclease/exonuclease/phosphatase (EEP) superfamily protein YafD
MRWLDRLVLLGVLATAGTLAVGELGRLRWDLELLSHFAVQYACALALAFVYFLLRRRWLWFGVTVAALLLPAWRLAPYAPLCRYATCATAGTHGLRVMTINVQASNSRYDLVRAEIERFDPDVVFLPESTDRWAAALAPLRARYPYVVDGKSPSVFSLLLFSRLPLAETAIVNLPEPGGFPAVVARVCAAGAADAAACVRLIGVHPPPPMTATWAAERDAALGALPGLVAAAAGGPTILLGDFNCTPWSPRFRDLLAASGLRDTAPGFGLSPTWFARWPLGLKIDHILVGGGIGTGWHEVGGDVGSDHFPVVVDLRF